jgi:hypothetical protein
VLVPGFDDIIADDGLRVPGQRLIEEPQPKFWILYSVMFGAYRIPARNARGQSYAHPRSVNILMSSAFGKLNGGALSTMSEFHTQRASRPLGLSQFGLKEPIGPGKFSVTITHLYLLIFDNTELIAAFDKC